MVWKVTPPVTPVFETWSAWVSPLTVSDALMTAMVYPVPPMTLAVLPK